MPSNRSALRRLACMLLWLVVLDPFVPAIVHRLEARRYEHGSAFRFENSDLFGLGPLVSYLREHPRGERRRVIFLGDSMVFGYLLHASEALPAQYEAQQPGTRVFNMAINGQELGSSYLISKATIDSVDAIYIRVVGKIANPRIASLIPVDAGDLKRFAMPLPDPVEHRLEQGLGRVWRLYRFHERVQAALFGTSTRQYLYLHKRDIALALLRPFYKHAPPAASWPPTSEKPSLAAPRAPLTALRATTETEKLMIDLADLARARRKRVVFIHFEYQGQPPEPEVGQFNTAYAPFAERVVVFLPKSLTYDGQHLTPEGGRLVAELLGRHEAEVGGAR